MIKLNHLIKLVILFLLCLQFLISCNLSNQLLKVRVDNKNEIEIPKKQILKYSIDEVVNTDNQTLMYNEITLSVKPINKTKRVSINRFDSINQSESDRIIDFQFFPLTLRINGKTDNQKKLKIGFNRIENPFSVKDDDKTLAILGTIIGAVTEFLLFWFLPADYQIYLVLIGLLILLIALIVISQGE
jgi:hypothetical protein